MTEPERRRRRSDKDTPPTAGNAAYPYQPSELGLDADEAIVTDNGAVPDRAADAPQDLLKPHLLTDSLTQAEEKILLPPKAPTNPPRMPAVIPVSYTHLTLPTT